MDNPNYKTDIRPILSHTNDDDTLGHYVIYEC